MNEVVKEVGGEQSGREIEREERQTNREKEGEEGRDGDGNRNIIDDLCFLSTMRKATWYQYHIPIRVEDVQSSLWQM